MKKFILLAPFFVLTTSISFFMPKLEAGGCSSHSNQTRESNCLSSDKECNDSLPNKNKKQVEA